LIVPPAFRAGCAAEGVGASWPPYRQSLATIFLYKNTARQPMEDAMVSRWAGFGSGVAQAANAGRLHDLARRCRELAELTAVPEVTNELESIAKALEEEAGGGERD